MLLPDGFAFVRWIAANESFDLVQRCNAFQRFFGNTRALGRVDVEERAPDMSETSDFLDIATPIKLLEASIAIGIQPTSEVFQMIAWPPASAIRHELVERYWMWVTSPIPFIPEIDP